MRSRNKLFIFILVLSACSKEISLDIPPYSSKLVLNGEFNTENIISIQVSRSLPVMESVDSSGYLIKSATVLVYENGIFLDTAKYFSGRFEINKSPKPGASYKINVSSGSYIPVQASLKMPDLTPLTVQYIDSIGLDQAGFKLGQINLSFTDNGSVKSYYKLLIRNYNAGFAKWFSFDIKSNDILFLNNDKLNDGGYIFSDRTFSGKTKFLSFTVPFGVAMGTPKFEISLKTFDEDYYDYMKATDDYSQSGNGFSNDPIILKTNVENGLGMIGGVCNSKDTIF